MPRFTAHHVQVSASQCTGDDEGSGLDAIGNDAMLGPMQPRDSANAYGRCAGTRNLSAHFVEQVSQIGNFRFASAIPHDGLAIGQRRCHKQIFCPGYRDLVENDFGAAQAFRARFHVAMFLSDGCAKLLELCRIVQRAGPGPAWMRAWFLPVRKRLLEMQGHGSKSSYDDRLGRIPVPLQRPSRPATCASSQYRGPAEYFPE